MLAIWSRPDYRGRVRITPRDVESAVSRTEDADPATCALVLDVLTKQAEGRVLFAGKDFVEARAAEHGVDTDTKVGDAALLALLEQGPAEAREYAMLCALAVRGLRAHLDDDARVERFVGHADWLTLSTPYAPYPFVEPILGDDADVVWSQLNGEADSSDPRDAAFAALHRALRPAGAAASDSVSDSEAPAMVIEGRMGRIAPSGWRGVLRLISGWALLQWIGRFLAWCVGVRRTATLKLVSGGVRFEHAMTLLGRPARSGHETFTLAAVASSGRSERFPRAHLLVGAITFAIGVLLGGLVLFEGIRSGETVLLLIGAGLILGGGALDLALSTYLPGREGVVSIDLSVLPKRRVQVSHVPEESAEAFLRELRERLPKR